jgi:hypothetical protein
MVVLCLNFTACGDDDDDDTPTSEKLVGQWTLVYEEGYEKDPAYPDDDETWAGAPGAECHYYGHFTFKSDESFTEYEMDNSTIGTGTWILRNNTLALLYTGTDVSDDLEIIELTSNKLILQRYDKRSDGEVRFYKMTYQKK